MPDVNGGTGFRPVSCVLQAPGFDVHAAGSHPFVWSALLDNTWDANHLSAIPAGLGMSFAFNGTSGLITVTESALFALTIDVSVFAGDATWVGRVAEGFSGSGNQVESPVASNPFVVFSEILYLPVTAAAQYIVETITPATGNPLTMNGTLSIVRLG